MRLYEESVSERERERETISLCASLRLCVRYQKKLYDKPQFKDKTSKWSQVVKTQFSPRDELHKKKASSPAQCETLVSQGKKKRGRKKKIEWRNVVLPIAQSQSFFESSNCQSARLDRMTERKLALSIFRGLFQKRTRKIHLSESQKLVKTNPALVLSI